ncbi:conserved hypothetical protein [Paraburkholderia piptadeniae]|uniref:Uncharacterized protein n=1 Tax=Paraburkholderia piptadeniae TaxID=1701573 RepID=A0A1N7RLB7_9BURK|nr:conserved hypothetical protein [Paraburkholderia piptadeniae]
MRLGRPRAEGVGPCLIGAGHPDVDILPRKEAEICAVLELDREDDRAVRRSLAGDDPSAVGRRAGTRDIGVRGDLDHAVGTWAHLAGENLAGARLLRAKRIFHAVAQNVLAGLADRLAGATHTITAIEWNIDLGANGGIGDALALLALDETGHSVLKTEGYLMGHGVSSRAARTYRSASGMPGLDGARSNCVTRKRPVGLMTPI